MSELRDALASLIGRFTADRDAMLVALDELATTVAALHERLEALEQRLGGEGPPPSA